MTANNSTFHIIGPGECESPPTRGHVSAQSQIGFVGLGHMGAAMAANRCRMTPPCVMWCSDAMMAAFLGSPQEWGAVPYIFP